jgi:beta-lactamase superfamily II metal-dependent hydrolase
MANDQFMVILAYGMAGVLLAGDAEVGEEEYMTNGSHTDLLTCGLGSEMQTLLPWVSAPC